VNVGLGCASIIRFSGSKLWLGLSLVLASADQTMIGLAERKLLQL
jgi:hypothetical protein